MSVLVTNTKGLEHVHKILEQWLPYSALVYCMTKNIIRGSYLFYRVWVDKYPDFHAVAIVPDSKVIENPYYKKQMFLYGTDDESLVKLLDDPCVIDWDSKLFFNGITPHTRQVLDTYLREIIGRDLATRQPDIMYTSSDAKDIIHIPAPDGVVVGDMSLEVADKANSLGLHLGDGSYEYFRDLVNLKQISICLYHQESKEPLGWAIQHMSGELGNLHVVENYRRKGFGKFIMSSLVKKAIEKDRHAFVFVKRDNFISNELQERVGLRRVKNEGYIWQKYGY